MVNQVLDLVADPAIVRSMRAKGIDVTGSAPTTDQSVLARLRGRLRYGLLTQEVLDRLARAGMLFYPYYLVKESASDAAGAEAPPASVTFARLERDQAQLVAGLPCRPREVGSIARRMDHAMCFGMFDGPELIGYTWANLAAVPTAIGRDVLFELGDDGAYLYDMYVARAHRGKRLAPWLRRRVHESLASAGRRELYSNTLSHNRSSRRFKARLGAVEIEKRLALGLRRLFGCDIRLRSLVPRASPARRIVKLRGWPRNV